MVRSLVAALGALALLVGCASDRPNLKRLYEISADQTVRQNPVVLVPGVFGTKLRLNGSAKTIWTDDFADLLFGGFDDLAVSFDPQTLIVEENVEPYGLFEDLGGVDYYGRIQSALAEAGRFQPTRVGTTVTGSGRRQYVFLYVWRLDLTRTAAHLDEFIEQIRRDQSGKGHTDRAT